MNRLCWSVGFLLVSSLMLLLAQDVSSALMEKEAYQGVNQYRTSHSLDALSWDDSITAIARGHSRDMALHKVPFGHEGFMHRVRDAKAALPGTHAYGENVFMANYPGDLADLAVQSWLKSPEHYKNIVGDYNVTGMGVWQTPDGYIYFTQFFVKQSQFTGNSPAPLVPGLAGMGLGGSPFTR